MVHTSVSLLFIVPLYLLVFHFLCWWLLHLFHYRFYSSSMSIHLSAFIQSIQLRSISSLHNFLYAFDDSFFHLSLSISYGFFFLIKVFHWFFYYSFKMITKNYALCFLFLLHLNNICLLFILLMMMMMLTTVESTECEMVLSGLLS